MLPKEQIQQIKQQLFQQIESNFPEDKKELAKQQIQEMNDEEFEDFLIQNNLIKPQNNIPTPSHLEIQEKSQENPKTQPLTNPCIFCAIIQNQIPSYKIDENKDSIAVLEIKPISKGHVLILPKKHISKTEKLPSTAFSLAKKISKKLQSKLEPKPKEVQIVTSTNFGHEIINVFPVYNEENISSPRTQAQTNELEQLKKQLEKKPQKPKKKKSKPKESFIQEKKEKLWLPKRFP